MISHTVTELVDFQDCPLIWLYHDVMGLRPKTRPPQLASGTAVHKVIERLAKGEITVLDTRLASLDALVGQGLDGETAARYVNGVVRAVGRVPKWLLDPAGWQVEQPVAYTWKEGTAEGFDIEIRGRPDFFRVTDDEVRLIEVKTTDSDPLDYLISNPQHRYYSVLLSKLHPNRMMTFQYVCLPTGENEDAKWHEPWFIKPDLLAVAEQEMLDVVEDIQHPARPRWSWRCRRCDYVRIDTARVQGLDWEGIAKEEFTTR